MCRYPAGPIGWCAGNIHSSEVIEKIYWYALLSMLQEVKKYYLRGDYKAMNAEILQLKRIYSE
nr:hypothetical protein [Enterococcus innesii]